MNRDIKQFIWIGIGLVIAIAWMITMYIQNIAHADYMPQTTVTCPKAYHLENAGCTTIPTGCPYGDAIPINQCVNKSDSSSSIAVPTTIISDPNQNAPADTSPCGTACGGS